MKKMVGIFMVALMVSMFATGIAYAEGCPLPMPITAEQAFDAYANQVDPVTGEAANVAIVDVRTTAEYYWVGTCAQVDRIIMNEDGDKDDIIPDSGKVILKANSRILKFDVDGEPRALNVKHVEKIETSAIARHIPYMNWNDENCEKMDNENFADEIEALAGEGIQVIILMCRSGKRTNGCAACFNTDLFDAVYEIDQDGKDGRGGFQGTSYGDAYNGFRGFSGRETSFQDHESVSWCDAGLPIHIGWCEDQYLWNLSLNQKSISSDGYIKCRYMNIQHWM